MNELTNEQKRIIGLLSGYYRKEKYKTNSNINSTWRVENFILDERGFQLCSLRTYERIATGKIIDNDVIYYNILRKLGYVEIWEASLGDILYESSERLLKAIWECNLRQLDDEITNLQNLIKPYEEYFYLSEYNVLLSIIKEYYLCGIYIDDKLYYKYLNIYSIFDGNLQVIIRDMLFDYVTFRKNSYKLILNLFKKINYEFSGHPNDELNYCLYLMYNQEAVAAFNKLEKLKLKVKQSVLLLRYIEICCFQLNLADSIQQSFTDKLESEIISLLSEKGASLVASKVSNFYYMLGMRKFNRKLYLETYPLLMQSLLYGQMKQAKNINIFLYHILKEEKNSQLDFIFNYDLEYSLNDAIGVFYRYFIIKNMDSKALDLENYIMNNILPKLNKEHIFFHEIFESELIDLIAITRNYKKLLKFRRKLAGIK